MPAAATGQSTEPAAAAAAGGAAGFGPVFVASPDMPGESRPPAGRSLFDRFFAASGAYEIPFPFEALLAELEDRGQARLRSLLVPIGRSLQRNAANPDFFEYPRVIVAVDGHRSGPENGWLLKDRLFLGYQERAEVIEAISYNEEAGRFEFQVVSNYAAGREPDVRYAERSVCVPCHQNHAPIFSRPLWDETNANADVAERLREFGNRFHGVPARRGVDVAEAFDAATDRANLLMAIQRVWIEGCQDDDSRRAAECRGGALLAALRYRLAGRRHAHGAGDQARAGFRSVLADRWSRAWPHGLAIPDPDIPNRRLSLFSDGPGLLDLPGRFHGEPLTASETAELIAVPPQLEPFRARDPLAIWRSDAIDEAFIDTLVAGLGSFFGDRDLRSLDAALAAEGAGGSMRWSSPCRLDTRTDDEGSRTRARCGDEQQGGELLVDASWRTGRERSASAAGTVYELRIPGSAEVYRFDIGAADVNGEETRLQLAEQPLGLRARTASGRAIGPLVIRTDDNSDPRSANVELAVGADALAGAIRELVDRASAGTSDSLGAAPIRPARIVAEVLVALGHDAPPAAEP